MHLQKKLTAAALAACLFLAAARFSAAETLAGNSDTAIAHKAAAELMAALKNELQAALQKGGPLAAIHICSTRAQALTAEIPGRIGRPDVMVRRTSLKFRNPANRPTPEEERVLRQLATQAQEGTALQHRTNTALHYYQPVLAEPLCLTCHGAPDRMDPAVLEALRQRYPGDLAVGYAAGDLRGMVSITVPVAPPGNTQ